MITIRGIPGTLLSAMLFLAASSLYAAEMSDDIKALQHEWAVIKYQTSESEQEKRY